MNSITSSNIWFAIDIDCGSTETITNMYLNDGHIRFTTDNYDPVVTSATYEDTTPVEGTWYKDALKLDGLDDTLINIDLSYGTGYSTLNGWSFSIINKCVNGSPFHKAILDTTSTYLLGSNITLYVVIDNVFYKRWVGIVSDYAISEDYFKINCDDKFIKNFNLFPKTTIGATNYPNALSDSIGKVIPVCFGDVKYADAINTSNKNINFKSGTSFPLARVKPLISTGDDTSYYGFKDDDIDFDAVDEACKVGFPLIDSPFQRYDNTPGTYQKYTPFENKIAICIVMPNTYDTSILVGKYLSLSNTNIQTNNDINDYHKILDVKVGSSEQTTASSSILVYLVIESLPSEITDYTNFYGNITRQPIVGITEMTSDSMYVFIWDISNEYKFSQNDVTFVNSINTNPKVLTLNGDITLYKLASDNNILKFNPITVNKLNNTTLNIFDGTAEMYHIPESALVMHYAANVDPTDIDSKGTSVSKVLDPTLVWDDDVGSLSRWSQTQRVYGGIGSIAYTKTVSGGVYNTNSDVYFRGDVNPQITAYKMIYNKKSFNPSVYDRVLPSPVWNSHATFWTMQSSIDLGGDDGDGTYHKAEVYGITDSVMDGKILTASMGMIKSPTIQSCGCGGTYSDLDGSNVVAFMSLPIIYNKVFDIPAPVDINTMTGLVYQKVGRDSHYRPLQVATEVKSFYGAVDTSVDGYIGEYTTYQGNLESLVLDRSYSNDSVAISDVLWNMFDIDGNITIVMELSNTNNSNIVTNTSKTVHCIGLAGYVDYKASDLYARIKGECLATVPNAFDLILTTYNGINYVGSTNLITYRGDWNVGRQITEQQDSLVYINELCQQSWVVGWTNRSGDVQLKAIEDTSVSYTHDDNIILRDSIKNFNLTPLTKVCNELTINADYNAITQKYDKIYSVDNIDQDTFPIAYDGTDNQLKLQNNINYDTYTSIQSYVDDDFMVLAVQNTHYNGIVQVGDHIRVNPFDILVYDTDSHTTLLASYYYDGNTYTTVNAPFGGAIKGTEGQSNLIVDEIILDTPTVGWTYIHCKKSDVTGILADVLVLYPNAHIQLASYYSEITKSDPNSDGATWKSWVQGINSYGDAKDIWNTCKAAWMENKTINKYPDALSNLSWFNNRNNFEDVTTYDETAESAYMFFKKAITWTTRQKYKLVYQVPLTSDTVKLELMDTVNFFDPMITGYKLGNKSYLNGSITSISCKPAQKVIEIELTAEMVYSTPSPYPVTGDIIERGAIEGINDIDIIEDNDNTDDIIEG